MMKDLLLELQSIVLHRVRVPLHEPFRISNGSVAEKDVVIVEVRTREGVVGWGEASPMGGSFYSGDTPDGAWQSLDQKLIPRVLDHGPIDAPRFYQSLRETPGEAFAKAGLEGALWDAHAKIIGVPLCQPLGGKARPIPSGVAIGIYDSLDELLARVDRFVRAGYRRVKIKIQPGWDVEPVRAVRESFPDVPLMVDANAAYTARDGDVFRELDQHRLMMIEQPLARDAHAEAATLQGILRTPICADESAESLAALDEIIERKAARVINIKLQRVGGIGEALLMLARAREAGLGAWVGTMPELGVASAHGLHFAALDGLDFPTDIEASSRWYVDDVIEPPISIDEHGWINLPPGSGMGYEVSREKLERYAVEIKEFSAKKS